METSFIAWLDHQPHTPLTDAVKSLYSLSTLRPPTKDELVKLLHKSSENEHRLYRNDYEQNKAAILAEDEQFANDILDGSVYALTKTGNDLIAYAPQDDGVFIYDLYVDESLRGQGIGSELLQHVVSQANGKPVRLCVAKGNTAAQSLYAKFGFKKVGEAADQYKMELITTLAD